MPRIEKVRLVGIKYDSMRKQYGDTTLDFMNGTEPAHTLLTLMNGGGKGLLLQMMFQLLLPLTKWGARGENRIEALFYNERKQLQPYTFHALIEWRLDTDPVRWLMTGIAVSAREKASAAEAEHESAEPRYLLYTLEQIKPGRYEIEDLPLYDADGRTGVSFEAWKDYLASRRSDFTTYTHTQTKDYFELLKSYDIERKEWETMRDINRQEGGVEAFFRKGLDNHSLFHDLIIPEIGKQMSGTDEEGNPGSLLDIFRHNAAIAQHLPKLLKREDAYRLLLQELDPVMLSLEAGVGHERDDREHRRIGAFLRHAMKEWLGEQSKEKEQWQAELERAEDEAKELRWQEDNLEYADKIREVGRLRRHLEESREKAARSGEAVEASRQQEALAQAIWLWNERLRFQEKAESVRRELELLQNADEHRHVKEELEQAENRLREEWGVVSGRWKETLARYGSLVGRMEAERRQAENEQAALQDTLQETYKLHGGVTSQLQTLNAEKMEMERAFGRLVNEAPEKLAAQWVRQQEEASGKVKELVREKEAAEQEKEAVQSRLAALQERIRQVQEKIANAERALMERRALEQETGSRLAVFLKLERPEAAQWQPEASWFLEAQGRLSGELERLSEELVRKRQELWTHQLDASLARNAYWVPNQEVKKLREELDSQGLRSLYGSEFLSALPEEERTSQLQSFPLLPYGLVLLDSEWKKRDPKRLSRLLLRAPVPLFLREQMKDAGERTEEGTPAGGAFRLRDGSLLLCEEGLELVNEPQRYDGWKRELLAIHEELHEHIRLLQERLEQAREHEQGLKLLLSAPHSGKLALELERLGKGRADDERQIKEDTEARVRVRQRIGHIESRIADLQAELDACAAKLARLEAWGKRLEQGRKWQQQKAGLDKEIQERKAELAEWSERAASLGDDLLTWRQAYLTWCSEQKQLLEPIKLLLRDVGFSFAPHDLPTLAPEAAKSFETIAEAELFASCTGKLQEQAAEVKALSASMEERSRAIGELRIHLDYAVKSTAEKEAELERAYPLWKQEDFPVKPIDVARSEFTAAARSKDGAIRDWQEAEAQANRLEGALESEEKRLVQLDRDIRRKHGKAPDGWPDQDLNERQAEIARLSQRNKSQLAECRRLLGELDRLIGLLDTQLRVLSAQRISGEAVYDLPADIRQSVRSDAARAVEQWLDKTGMLEAARQNLDREAAGKRSRFLQMIREQDWDEDLSGSLQRMMGEIRWDEYEYALDLLRSIKEHTGQELESLEADKTKAEQARDLWTDRACYRVIGIVKALKQMTNRMTFVNLGGHRYPLVGMDMRSGDLPEKPEDIRLLLREYFVRVIDELGEQYADFAAVPEAELEDRMSDSRIVLTALKSRYPTFRVYKPQTTNVFLYESPKKHHYTEWETLNKGSVTEAKGSGGQLLAARTIVMMMLMTYKRQIRGTKQWSVLISDNPFGQAVSPHILDPIFAIAENLHFQWIVLAPPELIKLDVSRRFPVFWELELKREAYGETVTERLQHGGRTFEAQMDLFGTW